MSNRHPSEPSSIDLLSADAAHEPTGTADAADQAARPWPKLGDDIPSKMKALPDAVASMARRAARRAVRLERKRQAELLERLRLQITRSEQLAGVGRVVAGLAHEINNPLTGLLGAMELMRESVANPAGTTPAESEDVRALLVDCGAMIDRIRELMSAVKGMSRDGSRDDIPFDPGRAIRDAVRVFAIARRKTCHVALTLPALPAVKGAPSRLGQVILNLLQNGLDASRDGGELRVWAESVDDTIRIRVADQGTGIPPELGARIFEPFFTTKGVEAGTGLGLFVCREIVTAMGGTIAFDSTPGGTTFQVDLPSYRPESSPLL